MDRTPSPLERESPSRNAGRGLNNFTNVVGDNRRPSVADTNTTGQPVSPLQKRNTMKRDSSFTSNNSG